MECENKKCRKNIIGKGRFWITGAKLCDECFQKWSDRHDRIMRGEVVKSEEELIEDTIEREIEEGIERRHKREERKKEQNVNANVSARNKSLFEF